MRRTLLIAAIVVATLVLVVLSATTALWISVGGTFFRGERLTVGTVLQIGGAVLVPIWILARSTRLPGVFHSCQPNALPAGVGRAPAGGQN